MINRIYEEKYTIDIRNSSLITTDIEVEFLEETSVFIIDKTTLILEVNNIFNVVCIKLYNNPSTGKILTKYLFDKPGCRGKLEVSAAPTEVGVHTSVLMFCVKDNPEIVTVTVACRGVVPIVEILPLTKMIGK